jgi:hypothetical protein
MNMHMHRMMSHSIWLNCLVIVIELLDADNFKFTAYGLYILQWNYNVQEILTIVGSMQDEALQENGMQFGACGKPQGWLHS